MNEAETRAELIDPKLRECGWGVIEDSKILREYQITPGKIQAGGGRAKKIIADYVLVYKGIKLAIVEAKSEGLEVGEGVAQAKLYAEKLKLETTYSTNGKEIYSICMKTGIEGLVNNYLTPFELWNKTFATQNDWREKFASVPFEDKGGSWQLRYYQEIAVKNTLEAIANNKQRVLLTLATGTGKTAIAFQIAWKLFQTRWNLKRDGSRRPRILFLADRNILANQAFNSFSSFPEDALIRISPKEITKKGSVPTNGSIFFTIFQTFMSGVDKEGNPAPYFGAYPSDYFDLIIIDECHRGGANDEGNWRGILEYFAPAVQLGLTATPKRHDNVDTYTYFGEPVYIYSLKEGINNGFLTPFKIRRIQTTLDEYTYTTDDEIIEGEVEEGKVYTESDFNKVIEMKAREKNRVKIYMDEANQNEKAIIFCATQIHAGVIRDLVNQYKKSTSHNYCVRVTANDGEIGEQFLREFQDNEKIIPTILTTSQKLSTGVDARNIRNIVLMRPVNSMIEFKQIVGRGTRLFDGKEFFTIYDFVDAYHHFADPEWDGEPEPEMIKVKSPQDPYEIKELREPKDEEEDNKRKNKKIKIRLSDSRELEIQHTISTSFLDIDGKPISAEEFLQSLFGSLPDFFTSEEELRTLWSNPLTRRTLLEKLEDAGFGKDDLTTLQKLIDAEKSDLFDVLEYVFNSDIKPITREERVAIAHDTIFALLNDNQKEFIEFVLSKYIESGVEELDRDKLPVLLTNKYHSLEDAKKSLGEVSNISKLFIEFQKYLYQLKVA
ncbi:MAG: DEAD/DEAH box helicase family protein [candidate division SR1 bacterium]|nr:DEAD/DEAH box helicase family protein [candidate division SR1 bacterium]